MINEIMTIKSIKRNFYIPESYVFKSDYKNPTTVISLTPFTSSSNYIGGLRAYSSPSRVLPLSSVGIHMTDDFPFLNSSLEKTSSEDDEV